ncbi:alanine--tRNA ligase-like [Selaginella moellendorffii]|uniref:alanine--tRNA ligase-like n=1 Tax=Selaginella moellendorffii TaxID=88036 RepID=UPI000D1C78D5|nr:alanine--tRNA ligase-like [Selaginella moellendorffii]|eukprot:XP_024541802.1 alanine--tRNA ligase-like [Selaginella moellendorffii]
MLNLIFQDVKNNGGVAVTAKNYVSAVAFHNITRIVFRKRFVDELGEILPQGVEFKVGMKLDASLTMVEHLHLLDVSAPGGGIRQAHDPRAAVRLVGYARTGDRFLHHKDMDPSFRNMAEQALANLKQCIQGSNDQRAKPLNPKSNMEWSGTKARDTFVDFFERRDHKFVRSSPVLPPPDDASLLFTNSGVVQFKRLLLGNGGSMSALRRACNSQKCIRAGGKHNDLDDVGKDSYHHTFFEMLGSWSFGDYFKEEVINWAWELLTQVYKLPQDRLYVTYFGGDEKLRLPSDLQARDIWLKFLPHDRVLPFGCKDNFWEMGEVGPCGPCSEIHFDRIGDRDAASLVNSDDPMCIEIWNLVFIQFNRETDGKLTPLPTQSIDTGMGLERLVSVLQNKSSNYDTDLFLPLFEAIQKATGARPYSGKMGKDDTDLIDTAYRVIADHVRTLTFAIADGCQPGNEGPGHVLRRILRRAIRYGIDIMKGGDGFFSGLVDAVVETMGDAYPELRTASDRVKRVLAEEEACFSRTLAKGVERFHKAAADVNNSMFSGQEAFLLWDTYGFPLDLTQLMAQEQYGFHVDVHGFHHELENAKQKARTARSKARGNVFALESREIAQLQKCGISPTNDRGKYQGYDDHQTTVAAIVTADGLTQTLEANHDGKVVGLILKSTTFYAEQGGQIYDVGAIESSVFSFQVLNVQSYGGYVVHYGVPRGALSVGDIVFAKVDYSIRSMIAPNHTSTHLLSSALRAVLGDHVEQKGSLVSHDKLRFDFSHGQRIEIQELKKIEDMVSVLVRDGCEVFSSEISLEKARKIQGLRTVVGEIYPDPVRVVAIGEPVSKLLNDPSCMTHSVELCGGTHLSNTRQAEAFAIVSEEGVAKGTRRLVAVTGNLAKEAIQRAEELSARVSNAYSLELTELEKASWNLRCDSY